MKYDLKNITKKGDLYQTYYLKFDNDISCYYYEAMDNRYVNVIEIIFEGYKISKIDNNNIYIFVRANDDINKLRDVLDFFNREYDNLKFNYRGFGDKYYDSINSISKGLKLNYEIINKDNFVRRNNNLANNNYVDYNINDNELIKKDEEEDKIDKELIKSSANYNGYNERLIDKNVKNIVNYNFNKKGNNNQG